MAAMPNTRCFPTAVGVAFARLARAGTPSLHLVGSTRGAERGALLRKTGFDDVALDVGGALELDGRMFDRVLELIGPATLKDSCLHVREGGIVCSTGQLGSRWYMDGFDPIVDLPANGYLTSFYSGNVDDRRLDELFAYIEEHGVDVAPERVFPLEDMVGAHRYLKGSHGFGKVVVTSSG